MLLPSTIFIMFYVGFSRLLYLSIGNYLLGGTLLFSGIWSFPLIIKSTRGLYGIQFSVSQKLPALSQILGWTLCFHCASAQKKLVLEISFLLSLHYLQELEKEKAARLDQERTIHLQSSAPSDQSTLKPQKSIENGIICNFSLGEQVWGSCCLY